MKTACGKIYLGPSSLLTMLCIFHKIGNTIQKQATTKRKLGNMSRLDLKNHQTISNVHTCISICVHAFAQIRGIHIITHLVHCRLNVNRATHATKRVPQVHIRRSTKVSCA